MLGVCALKIRHSEKKLEKEFTNLFSGQIYAKSLVKPLFYGKSGVFLKFPEQRLLKREKKLLKTVCVSNDAFHEFLLG